MIRLVLGVLAAATLLLVPATAQGDSSVRVRGTVALTNAANHMVTVRASRQAVALRVPGSLAAIRVGQRVELRGSTLRARGRGSRVLARNVSIASSQPLAATPSPKPEDDDDEANDDEVEIKGKLTSLAPLTVESPTGTVTCAIPSGISLAGFAVGDFVEITCDLKGGTWVLRKLEHEDDDDDDRAEQDDNHGGNSGPGGGVDDDDDDEDSSGPGSGHDDDDHDDDSSGPGGGDDDD